MTKRILLVSGGADVGKSALIKALFESVQHIRVEGFFTESVYVDQQRVGFALAGFDGTRYPVAHVEIPAELRLGKYGVDLGILDTAMRNVLTETSPESIFLIDEIGKLEMLSDYFCQYVEKLLLRECTVVMSSPLKGSALLDKVVAHPDVERVKMNEHNAQQIQSYARHWLQSRLRPV